MMYRAGWATKANQERILAFTLRKAWLFDLLRNKSIVNDGPQPGAARTKECVVQWDPDHAPNYLKLARRAIQIGMRGAAASEFAAGTSGPGVVSIEDITPFVLEMQKIKVAGDEAVLADLWVPVERVLELDIGLQSALHMNIPNPEL